MISRRRFLNISLVSLAGLYCPKSVARKIDYPPRKFSNHVSYIFFDAEDNLYEIHPIRNSVICRNSQGKVIWETGGNSRDSTRISHPVSIAADNNSRLYILDYSSSKVFIYDKQGHFLTAFSEYGDKNGQLKNPDGDLLFYNSHLYICDGRNQRLQIFSGEGEYISKVGEEPGKNHLSYPKCLAIDDKNEIFIGDPSKSRVFVYNSNGKYLRQIGDKKNVPGQLTYPASLLIDRSGNILVADSATGYINIFDNNGNFINHCRLYNKNGDIAYPLRLAAAKHDNVYILTSSI